MMSKSRWWLVVALVIAGCSRGLPPEAETPGVGGLASGQPMPISDVDLGTSSDSFDLAALLKLPRQDLALRCDEMEKTIRRQHQLHLEGNLPYTLLPDTRLPMVTPIFRQASYSKERGLSLPPYLKPDSHDPTVAFHLARHGDLEGAIDLLGPSGDDDTAKVIRESVPEKAYPLEWTRLISLLIHSQQVALATDNKDGAKNLIALHKQLRSVLDEKAKRGPLGVALLGRGLASLRQAATAWKANGRDDLSIQVQVALASLGEPPAYALALPPRIDDLAPAFAASPTPNALIASDATRVLDLLCIYVPGEGADTCVAFGDDNQKVKEILLTYRPQLVHYHLPEQFAESIEDFATGKEENVSNDCPRRVWDFGSVKLDVTLTPRHPTLGGLVRLQLPGTAKVAELPRGFGALHLDRTFEANRRLAAWGKKGATLVLTDKALADVTNPLPTRALVDAIVDREPKHDLVSRVTFEYVDNSKDSIAAAGTIARPMFAAGGRPTFAFGDVSKGSIDMVWTDAKTRYRLRFPYAKDKMIALDATDSSGTEIASRVQIAQDKDAIDRHERIKSSKPLAVVPRQLEGFSLGMTKEAFRKALPKSERLLERDIPSGLMAAYLGTAQPGDAMVREWFGRFDDDKLAELRIRYVDVPANKPGTFAKKLDAIKAKLGAPEAATDTAAIWADLPKRGNSSALSWQDDHTRMTVQHEPFGLEVTIRDCPTSHPAGVPLPAMEYLARGTGPVKLGMTKDALLKMNAQPTEGGAFLVEPTNKDDYDAVLAWLDKDRVTRVVARHKMASPMSADQKTQASKALLQKWAGDARYIGWPSRQDMAGTNLQSLASRDDATRYRLFWREDNNGVSIFSEWKDAK